MIFTFLKIKILVDCIVRITKVLLFSSSLAFFTDLRNFFHSKASEDLFLLIEGDVGIFGFGYFLDRFFGFFGKRLRFLGFGVHCGFGIFRVLASGFRFA